MTESQAKASGESVDIPEAAGSLAALVHLPERLPAPAVICCHGLLSSKDSAKFAVICEELSRAGFAAVRFDFSGCGASPPVFEATLLATRRRNLAAVLAYVRRQSWSEGHPGLLGSSLGGYLALLAAADPAGVPVEAVVCWATPFDLARIRNALEAGAWSTHASATPRQLGDPQNLSGLPPVSRVLVVHGQMDRTVDWRQAVLLYRCLDDPKQLLLFETAEHRFLDPVCRQTAIRASVDWFVQHLSSSGL
jgi:alpha-beta hydrolase superfamily lysophospholipase